MKDPVQVRLSGAGGQGLITAGVILAEAALLDGKNVVQTQTYGPEARLGSSRSEVIISRGRIAYPEVTAPDVLLCMSPEAARKFLGTAGPDTLVILDSTTIGVEVEARGRCFRLAITETAIGAGGRIAANTTALAVMNHLAELVTPESLIAAIRARVPERFRAINERAFEAGVALAKSTLASGNGRLAGV